MRQTNFYLDTIFIRKKLKNDKINEDKIIYKDVYSSLIQNKPRFWYTFEFSGNTQK